MRPHQGVVATVGLLLLAASPGCRALGSVFYFLSPRQWVQPEFTFHNETVVVLIEADRAAEDNPVFAQVLHAKLVEIFRDRRVAATIVPYQEGKILAQSNADFRKWSTQRIGRELGADYVLYLRLTDLRLREAPDDPIISARVSMRIKLIDVRQPADTAVVWPGNPRERDGRDFSFMRPGREAVTREVVDREARAMGIDVAHRVARYFYKYDAEETLPREP